MWSAEGLSTISLQVEKYHLPKVKQMANGDQVLGDHGTTEIHTKKSIKHF